MEKLHRYYLVAVPVDQVNDFLVTAEYVESGVDMVTDITDSVRVYRPGNEVPSRNATIFVTGFSVKVEV